VKALAETLHRDYKNVHRDVEELVRLGLIARSEEGLTAPADAVLAKLSL
jgi:predicted transcriptional regulator